MMMTKTSPGRYSHGFLTQFQRESTIFVRVWMTHSFDCIEKTAASRRKQILGSASLAVSRRFPPSLTNSKRRRRRNPRSLQRGLKLRSLGLRLAKKSVNFYRTWEQFTKLSGRNVDAKTTVSPAKPLLLDRSQAFRSTRVGLVASV